MPFPLSLVCRFALLPLLLSVAAIAGESVSRPGVLHLTVETAVRMALAKNFEIAAQRFEPHIARQGVRSELGRFDPRLTVNARRNEDAARSSFDTREGRTSVSNVTRRDTFGAGLEGETPWGLEYDFDLGTGNATGSRDRFDDLYSSDARLGLRQPLLQGFGADANLADLRIARTNLQVSEWELRRRIIDVITRTVFVYNELHSAQESLRVAEASRERSRQLLQDNMKRAEVGVMSPLNITSARAEVASRQEGVILAIRRVKDNENLLKQLVTNDLEAMLSVQVEIKPPPSPGFRADVQSGITDALALRPDYRQAVLAIERQNIVLAQRKDQALPRLDLVGSLRLLGIDDDLAASFQRIPSRDRSDWAAGVEFSVPIPNRAGRAGVVSAQLAAAQALVELHRLEQQIIVEVDNASGQIVTARERITSTTEARLLAKESLEAGDERLRAGTGTTFEVLELQEKLAEAEAAEIRARSDYNNAISDYNEQTGTTLRAYRLKVD